MSNRKSRFNLFKFSKKDNNLKWGGDNEKSDDKKKSNDFDLSEGRGRDDLGFLSFDSIIPENSPLKKKSDVSSGFYNDELSSRKCSDLEDDLEGVDEKYAKYIFSQTCDNSDDFNKKPDYNSYKKYKGLDDLNNLNNLNNLDDLDDLDDLDFDNEGFHKGLNYKNNEKLKSKLLGFKKDLSNKNKSSKTFFGKITFILIFLVLISSIFYFFVYQPFQNELELERNSKLNEINTLYKGPLEINENAYTLKDQVNHAYDVNEIKSVDVLMFATKDWRMYHSSKIVSSKDDFGRVMMSYDDNKIIIMSVKDANDFVKDNDARVLSNVQFEKVNTVIVPISLSRLQATAGLISVGSVVDVYSLNDNSTEYMNIEEESMLSNESGLNESSINEKTLDDESLESADEGPMVSGATVLAILRSKDSGLVDNTITRSNTVIKGNQTNPFENTSSYSSDVEEQLKASVLNSNYDNNALDSYLINYGVRLSNFERMSNLGDLDSQYIVLLEVPQNDVNFIINNMDDLILTIPTDFAPNWVVSELNETYYENLYQNQSLDFF